MNEYEHSLVKYITELYYDEFGTSVAFKCKNFSEIIYQNKSVLYKVDYNFSCYFNTKYNIEIYINKYIDIFDKIKRFSKCIYCNKRKVNSKLSCCDKFCHISCAINNNYNCNCIEDTENIIKLESVDEKKCNHVIEKKKENHDTDVNDNTDDNECIVCYNKCSTKTSCNHLICRECTNNIYKTDGINSKCPICRSNICNKNSNNYLVDNIFKDNPNYSVKVLINY